MDVDYSARSKSGQILPSVGCRQPDTLQTVVRLRILWVIMDCLCSVLDCLEDRWSMWVWLIVFEIFISRMTYEETEHSTRVNSVPPSPSPSCTSSALLNLISLHPPVEALPFLLTLEESINLHSLLKIFIKCGVYPSKNIGLPRRIWWKGDFSFFTPKERGE